MAKTPCVVSIPHLSQRIIQDCSIQLHQRRSLDRWPLPVKGPSERCDSGNDFGNERISMLTPHSVRLDDLCAPLSSGRPAARVDMPAIG